MPDYGNDNFWDTRYKTSLTSIPVFDWYNDYDAVKPVLASHLKRKEASILHVGCGNSPLPERLYDDGYKRVVNIDISASVIAHMTERNKEKRPELRFETCDVTELTEFVEDEFDLIIDKGTLDSLVCGQGAMMRAKAMCAEISRVLRPGGSFVCMSYSAPADREQFLMHDEQKHEWDIDIKYCKKPNLKDVKDGVKEKFQIREYVRNEEGVEDEEASSRMPAADASVVDENVDEVDSSTEKTAVSEKTPAETSTSKEATPREDLSSKDVQVTDSKAPPPAISNDAIELQSSCHFFYVMTKRMPAQNTVPVAPTNATGAASTAPSVVVADEKANDGSVGAKKEGAVAETV